VCLYIQYTTGLIIYVDSNSSAPIDTCGTSLLTACPTIEAGFDQITNSGDILQLQPGLYSGLGNENLMTVNSSISDIKIIGNGIPNDIVIHCSQENRFLTDEYYFISHISNILIRNCSALDLSLQSFGDGGAIIFGGSASQVVINNTVFVDNKARNGGAIFIGEGSLLISDCTFHHNEAVFWGGALTSLYSGITITDSLFEYNRAHGDLDDDHAVDFDVDEAGKGGAIHLNGGSRLTVLRSSFHHNYAQLTGGAVNLNLVAGTTIEECTFGNNMVFGGDVCTSDQLCEVRGGAVYVKDVALYMRNSTFFGNVALTKDLSQFAEGGAIILTSDSFSNERIQSTISNCTFLNNSARGVGDNNAGGYGGALFSDGIPTYISQSHFEANNVQSDGLFTEFSSNGGAVYISTSAVGEIVDTHFTKNIAQGGKAGAVYLTESSRVTLRNCTFLKNSAISSYVFKAQGGAIAIGHSSYANVEWCRFVENYAQPKPGVYPKTYSGTGGAIFAMSSGGNVTDSFFVSNIAFSGQFDSGASGGAVGLENAVEFSITDSVFMLNSARGFYGTNTYSSSGSGGAVAVLFSSIIFQRCLFQDNWVSAGGSQYSIGGGVAVFYEYASDSDKSVPYEVSFSDCQFHHNVAGGEVCTTSTVYRAGQGGGIGVVGVSSWGIVINNTVFHANMAMTDSGGLVSSFGGAIMYSQGSRIGCNECKFSKNVAWNGLGDDICSGYEDMQDVGEMDLALYEPILDSPSNVEAFRIHERFALLAQTVCDLTDLDFSAYHHDRTLLELDAVRRLNNGQLVPTLWNATLEEHIMHMWPNFDTEQVTDASNVFRTHLTEADTFQDVALSHRQLLMDTSSRIYPAILVMSGSATIYLPVFNNTYEICAGDLVTVLVQATEGSEGGSVNGLGKNPTLVIIGSISTSDLVLVGIAANVTIVDQSPLRSLLLQSLVMVNSTLYFSNNMTVLYSSALMGSVVSSHVPKNISNVTLDNFIPFMNFYGTLKTGFTDHGILNEDSYIIQLLEKTDYSSRTVFERCTLRVYGELYLSAKPTSNTTALSSVALHENATMVITSTGRMYVDAPANIISENPNYIAVVNLGLIALSHEEASYLNPLSIDGILVQRSPGMLTFTISNENYNTPVLTTTTNVTLLGTINVSTIGNTDFIPSSDSDTPTEWKALQFTGYVAPSPQVPAYVFPEGVNFDTSISSTSSDISSATDADSLDIFSLPSIPLSAAANEPYSQTFTTSEMSCQARFEKYATGNDNKGSDTDYMCWICLKNHSCGYCGLNKGGCIDESHSCEGGAYKRKDGNCCPQSCNDRGSCHSSNGHTKFECHCDFFYAGTTCSDLSVYAYLLIAAGVFLILIFLITLRYYFYYRQQKNKVLQELRVGLLTGSADTSTDGENRSYLQAIQQDLILRDVFVNYDEIVFEGKIGEGSFGEVFKASFRGAQVAVKQMRAPVFMQLTENDIEEFRTEAYMMSRLRHPNIVLVMGVSIVEFNMPAPPPGFEDDDDIVVPGQQESGDSRRNRSLSRDTNKKKSGNVVRSVCIITEYLEQGSLADILYGSNKVVDEIWTYELVLTCALQAARGMLYLHSHQPPICHRDLKSSNLVVDDHWVVKVTDFGMSRIVPMKIQNIEKGIEKSDGSGFDGMEQLTSGSAQPQVDKPPSDPTTVDDAENRNGKEDIPEDSPAPKKSVKFDEDLNVSWERESILNQEDGSERNSLSNSNTLMTSNLGTTAWCAPELLTATNKTRYSVKVDVYSFGMVLWELWERKRPYEELYSRFDIIDAVREGRRPAISSTCPPAFRSLIQRCWHEQPARRPTFAYIVRYIKDELAHIKRQRMSSVSTAGSSSTFSPLHQLLLNSRRSVSSNTTSGESANAANTANAVTEKDESPAVESPEDTPTEAADDSSSISSESRLRQSITSWAGFLSPIPSRPSSTQSKATQNESSILPWRFPVSMKTENAQESGGDLESGENNTTSRATISYLPPTSTLPASPLAVPKKPSQENLDQLAESPWGRSEVPTETPEHVTDRASLGSAPSTGSRGVWRDKYVMRFSGWKSSDPDSGLPPSLTSASRGGLTAAQVAPPPAYAVESEGEIESPPETGSDDSAVRSSSFDEPRNVEGDPLPPHRDYELDTYSSSSSLAVDGPPIVKHGSGESSQSRK